MRVEYVREVVGNELERLLAKEARGRKAAIAIHTHGNRVRLSMGEDMDERFVVVEPDNIELKIRSLVVGLFHGGGKRVWSNPIIEIIKTS